MRALQRAQSCCCKLLPRTLAMAHGVLQPLGCHRICPSSLGRLRPRVAVCSRTSSCHHQHTGWEHAWGLRTCLARKAHRRTRQRAAAGPPEGAPGDSSTTGISTTGSSTTTSTSSAPSAVAAPLNSLEDAIPSAPGEVRQDLTRAAAVTAVVALLAVLVESNRELIAAHQELVMLLVFGAGYLGIIVEELLEMNKAGVALLMAAALWAIRADASPLVQAEITESLSDVSAVVFFLIGAMTIVECVDQHQGFKLITDVVRVRSKASLLWLSAWIAFFMSSVLDNLTTCIVMISLLQKICPDTETRRYLGAVVVIAANAGGAWTPIGDVTTTMLWVGGQISTASTMSGLFIPSAVSLLLPVAGMTLLAPEVQGDMPATPPLAPGQQEQGLAPRGKLVLALGLGALLSVPVFKAVTGLPPWLGMVSVLGFMWLFVDTLHLGEDKRRLSVSSALKRIDTEGVLFFLGILMAVGALDAAGVLQDIATHLDTALAGRQDLLAFTIGLASALVDNVPLVAATMSMYSLDAYPQDSALWQMVAFAAGTGGSILIIGSASGVAFMGLESAKFGWYARLITPWALVGYAGGLASYLLLQQL